MGIPKSSQFYTFLTQNCTILHKKTSEIEIGSFSWHFVHITNVQLSGTRNAILLRAPAWDCSDSVKQAVTLPMIPYSQLSSPAALLFPQLLPFPYSPLSQLPSSSAAPVPLPSPAESPSIFHSGKYLHPYLQNDARHESAKGRGSGRQ